MSSMGCACSSAPARGSSRADAGPLSASSPPGEVEMSPSGALRGASVGRGSASAVRVPSSVSPRKPRAISPAPAISSSSPLIVVRSAERRVRSDSSNGDSPIQCKADPPSEASSTREDSRRAASPNPYESGGRRVPAPPCAPCPGTTGFQGGRKIRGAAAGDSRALDDGHSAPGNSGESPAGPGRRSVARPTVRCTPRGSAVPIRGRWDRALLRPRRPARRGGEAPRPRTRRPRPPRRRLPAPRRGPRRR